MTTLAETFPPGDFIREELEAREWTQSDLANIMGRPVETINRLIAGKLAVTPETAKGLGAAFGTSADYWLNLQTTHQLSQVDKPEIVERRARLYEMAPVAELVKREWIEKSSNVAVLEKQIIDLYELKDIDENPTMRAAARKSTTYDTASPSQIAWYFYAKRLASELDVGTYSKKKLANALDELKLLASHPQEIRHVPRILADAGVRFVIVKQLSRSKIDGAAFWLGKARKKPVVAMSMRYDRIDYFWHTLSHELAHILHNDEVSLDDDMVGHTAADKHNRPEFEQRADEFACKLLVPPDELNDFIGRIRPLYAKKKIIGFANRIGVHPGIVVGQLQYREEISYSHSRDLLAKVRDVVISSALTDGWRAR